MAIKIKIKKPFARSYLLTQQFGARYKYLGIWRSHMGTDYACPNWTPILAVANGTISRIQRLSFGYGKNITINHGRWSSFYAHLSKISIRNGRRVVAGQVIGYSGRSGFWRGKTGYHLHFGMKIGSRWINPRAYVKGATLRLKSKPKKPQVIKRYYLVKKGDTLWGIARRNYGKGTKWRKIYNANRSIIVNPNLIRPGQRLRIP